jgi:hypothetical protein
MYTPLTGICLLGASISAIAAVGSVFELTSGTPELGMAVTGSILAAAIPLTVILFMTAVKNSR